MQWLCLMSAFRLLVVLQWDWVCQIVLKSFLSFLFSLCPLLKYLVFLLQDYLSPEWHSQNKVNINTLNHNLTFWRTQVVNLVICVTARKQSMWLLLKMYPNNTVFTLLPQGSSLDVSFSIIDSFFMNYMPYTCEQWLYDPLALTNMITHWTEERSNTALLKKKDRKNVVLFKWKSDNSRALFI